jgi:hypothetical protein
MTTPSSAVDFLMGPAPGEPGAHTTLNGHAKTTSQPYGSAALRYAQKDYTGIIPLVRSTKLPAFKGAHGRDGKQTQPDEYADPKTIAKYAAYNLAWRLPTGYVGIDVDHGYDDGHGNTKAGADTLASLETRLGPLPPTWTSTARGETSPSRIHFFKIPKNAGELEGAAGPDIDTVQHHLRYAVVAPSVHPKTGSKYQWYDPDGKACGPPGLDDIPYLPASWLEHLSKDQRDHTPGAGRSVEEFEEDFTDEFDPDLVDKIRTKFSRKEGSRHDTMMQALGWAARAAVEGKVAAKGVFNRLEEDWYAATGDGREDEFNDLLSTAVRDAPDAPEDDTDELFLTREALVNLPAVEPLIEDMINKASVVWLSGKFGTYKTFLALAWAGCIATGKDWEGHRVCESGPVLYIAAEGHRGILSRIAAWEQAFNDGDLVKDLTVTPKGLNPTKPEEVAKIIRQMRKTGAKVVIFDTLHRCAPGIDENQAKDQGTVMEGLQKIKDETGCTVIMLAHTGYEGIHARGSSSQEDDADDAYVIKLDGPDNEDRSPDAPRVLIRRKTKEGEAGQRYALRLGTIPGPDPFEPKRGAAAYITLGDAQGPRGGTRSTAQGPSANVQRIMREMNEADLPLGLSFRRARAWLEARSIEIRGKTDDWRTALVARQERAAMEQDQISSTESSSV